MNTWFKNALLLFLMLAFMPASYAVYQDGLVEQEIERSFEGVPGLNGSIESYICTIELLNKEFTRKMAQELGGMALAGIVTAADSEKMAKMTFLNEYSKRSGAVSNSKVRYVLHSMKGTKGLSVRIHRIYEDLKHYKETASNVVSVDCSIRENF